MSSTYWRSARIWFGLILALASQACSSQSSLFSGGLTKPPTVVNFTVSDAKFTAASLGAKTELTLTLSVSGGYRPSLLAQTLESPFRWVGGAFPGTGGTCRSDRIMNGCSVRVEFEPVTRGIFSKTLSLTYQGGAESTETLDLPIMGATPAEVILRTPPSVSLGDAVVGFSTSVVVLEIEHLSGAPATGLSLVGSSSAIAYEGGHFPGSSGTCPQTLVSGSCKVAIVVTPSQSGNLLANAALEFEDGADEQQLVTTLSATVRHPAKLRASPALNPLGRIYLGGFVDFPITLTYLEGDHDANGLALLGLAGEVTFAGGAYPGTGGNCPNSISSGSCTIMLRAQPQSLGVSSRQLRIAYRSGSIWAYADTELSWEASKSALLSWGLPSNPASPVDFGTVTVGSSVTQEFWVHHTDGDAAASSLQVSLPQHFARTGGTCGTSLAIGGSCSILISFAPTANGNLSGNLTLQYFNGGSQSQITRPLSGTTEARLAISPASGHSFGTLAVGALSTQTFTVSHVGGVPASGLAPSISGGAGALSVSATTCGASLSGASCTVTVSLQPSSSGAISAHLVIQFGNGLSTDQVSVPLSATVVPPAVIAPASSTVDFGNTVSGGSYPQTLRLNYQSGGAPATGITTLNLGAPFSLTSNGCSSGLHSMGQSCDLVFSAQPTSAALHSRTITVRYHDGATLRTHSVVLSTSTLSAAVLSIDGASPYPFGAVATGSSSAQTLTLRHTSGGVGATAINSSAPSGFRYVGGSFPGSGGTCSTTLGVGQTCTLALEFAPATRGTFNPAIAVGYHDGAAGRSTTKNLLGYTQARITTSAGATLQFGSRATGSLHTQSFNIQHGGGLGASSLVASISGAGFSIVSNACSSSLTSGSCTVTLGFNPTAMGAYTGNFTLDFNNGFSADSITLPVTGTGSTPALLEIVGSTSIPGSPVNGSSTDLALTLRNSGGAPATSISSAHPSAVFRYKTTNFPGSGGNCGTSLAVGAQCTLMLNFIPTVSGTYTPTLLVSYHNGNVSTSVSASLSATSIPPAVLTLGQSSLSFTVTPVGSGTSVDLTLQKSAGTGPASNLRFAGLNSPFSFYLTGYPGTGGDCPSTLSNAGPCTLRFGFSPSSATRVSAPVTLTYFDGVVDRVLSFTLSAYTPAQYTLTPASGVVLGDRAIHGSHTTTFTLTRSGGPASVALSAQLSGAGFQFAGGSGFPGSGGSCTATWSGSSCTLVVALEPNILGPWSGTLQLTGDTGMGTAQFTRSVSLTARNPALLGSPDSLISFPDTAPGSSTQEIIILENAGELPVGSMSGAISGAGFDFVGSSYPGTGGTCGATLAAGNSCTVLVRFSPSAAQTYLANLLAPHHDGAQTQTFALPLRGTGSGAAVAGKTASRTRSIHDQDHDHRTDTLLEVSSETLAVISSATGNALYDVSPPLGLGPLESYSVWSVADVTGDGLSESLWQWSFAEGSFVTYEVREAGTGRILKQLVLEKTETFLPLKFTAQGSPQWNSLRFENGMTWGPWLEDL